MLQEDGQFLRALVLAAVAAVSYFVYTYLQSPLRRVPGPFLAAFTNLWRLRSLRTGRSHLDQIQLHHKFGRAVRIGPNVVSLSDPTLIPTVYSTTKPWLKSEMYSSNDVYVDGVKTSNVFATTDNEWHTKMVKPLRNMGTISKTLVNCEVDVDETISLLCVQLDRLARDGASVPMQKWMLYFAYDTLHKLTFDFHRGYVETGSDVGNFIGDAYGSVVYFGWCACMPVLDKLIAKNPLMKPFLGTPPFLWAFQQAYAEVAKRKAAHEAAKTSPGSNDFLDLFLAAKTSHPDIVTGDDVVVNYLFLNLVAGSDTTGTTLAVIIYHLYRNSEALAKLRAELSGAGYGPDRPALYRDAVRLPYLNAVIQEGLRIHPPIGLTLERVVPAGGWSLPDGGPFLPAGTKVGMNSWVSNRDTATFGPEDVDAFVPERWLKRSGETDAQCNTRTARMSNLMLTFGHGSRVCTGKSVAMVELVKLTATFIQRYDLEFLTPNWKTENIWFVFPSEFDVKIKRKDGVSSFIVA